MTFPYVLQPVCIKTNQTASLLTPGPLPAKFVSFADWCGLGVVATAS